MKMKVVQSLREQGIKKSDLTREQFWEKAWKCLKNKRLRELIISYINQNRKEYVAC